MFTNFKHNELAFLLLATLSVASSRASAAPAISSLSVFSGPVGTVVTITGSGFGATQGSSTVTFNGTGAGPATDWSDMSVTVNVPVGATTGPVVVNVSGVGSNGVSFTVTPFISDLSLTTGPVQMGFQINGTSFGSQQGSSTVKIGSVVLTVVPNGWTDSQITVDLPASAVTGNVVVTVSGQPSNGVNFTVIQPIGCT